MKIKIHIKSIFGVAVVLCAINLSACAFFPAAPQDLQFESVSVVSTESLSASEQLDISSRRFNPFPRKVMSVNFVSNEDFVRHRKNWANPYLRTAVCSDLRQSMTKKDFSAAGHLHTSEIYWNDIDVFSYLEESLPSVDELFVYHFYIDISRENGSKSYDLASKAEDVCFRIITNEMLSSDAKTNVVTIPQDAIAAALKKADNL